MAKIIKLTPEMAEQCRKEFDESLLKAKQEFEESLSENKLKDGKVDYTFSRYTKSFNSDSRKATLHFTEIAWMKMKALIREFSTEVAWHGIAYRDEDETKDDYYITDILVYPQKVTGGNVETDQEKYQTWLYSLEDEQFNNVRMQGHSHVNMDTSPSAVDLAHQAKIIGQLEDDMFYIFMIWNKSDSKNIKIYDLRKNVLFEKNATTNDVDVVISEEIGIDKFIKEAKEICKPPVTTYPHYSGYQHQGYQGAASQQRQASTPIPINRVPAVPKKEEPKKKAKAAGVVSRDIQKYRNDGCEDDDYGYDDEDEYFNNLIKDPFGVYDGRRPYYGGY